MSRCPQAGRRSRRSWPAGPSPAAGQPWPGPTSYWCCSARRPGSGSAGAGAPVASAAGAAAGAVVSAGAGAELSAGGEAVRRVPERCCRRPGLALSAGVVGGAALSTGAAAGAEPSVAAGAGAAAEGAGAAVAVELPAGAEVEAGVDVPAAGLGSARGRSGLSRGTGGARVGGRVRDGLRRGGRRAGAAQLALADADAHAAQSVRWRRSPARSAPERRPGAGGVGSGGGGCVLTTIGAPEIACASPSTAAEPVPGA